MKEIFAILKDTLPLQVSILIVIFLYFLKAFRDIANEFIKIAQQQASYMKERVDSVDKTTTIFERTVKHQEKDLERLYASNKKLQEDLKERKEQGINRLDEQLEEVIKNIEELRQETISREELEHLREQVSLAKEGAEGEYRNTVQSLSHLIEERPKRSIAPKEMLRGLILMPFSEAHLERYAAIQEAAEQAGLRAFRSDDALSSEADIASNVRRSIQDADIVLVDVSEKNANVMYELGYAHALRVPVILLSAPHREVPFDVKNLRVIVFDTTPRGVEVLRSSLSNAVEEVKQSLTRLDAQSISADLQNVHDILAGAAAAGERLVPLARRLGEMASGLF